MPLDIEYGWTEIMISYAISEDVRLNYYTITNTWLSPCIHDYDDDGSSTIQHSAETLTLTLSIIKLKTAYARVYKWHCF